MEINPKLPNKESLPSDKEVQFLPMKLVEELTGKIHLTETRLFKEVQKSYTSFINGDVLFAKVTPCMENGKIAIVDKLKNGIGFGSSEYHVLRTKNSLDKKFLRNFLIQKSFRLDAQHNMTGAVGLRRVPKKFIEDYEIPLPPLPEQHAIVSKLEELFSELDKGKQQLELAQQQLKVYRQAVLKWAFEGRLTNKDVKDGELPEGWKWVKVSDISDVVRGGSPRPAGDPKYYGGDIPFLKVKDITKDSGIYLNQFEYTIKETGLKKTRQIKPNTLLLSNSGATLGVPKICMINATMNDGIAAFLNLDIRSNFYLYYFWLSKTRDLRNINMGAAQPNLNTDIIKSYDVPYCSIEEQQSVVQEIESRLSVCDKVEETINQGLAQAETLRQSILKKAFEGKLLND